MPGGFPSSFDFNQNYTQGAQENQEFSENQSNGNNNEGSQNFSGTSGVGLNEHVRDIYFVTQPGLMPNGFSSSFDFNQSSTQEERVQGSREFTENEGSCRNEGNPNFSGTSDVGLSEESPTRELASTEQPGL